MVSMRNILPFRAEPLLVDVRQTGGSPRFACGEYTDGTSGSPWVTHFDRRTRTGTIVGVIGGYEQGGGTPAISYSSYFGPAVQQLYQQAIAAGARGGCGGQPGGHGANRGRRARLASPRVSYSVRFDSSALARLHGMHRRRSTPWSSG
jgi:hypothetical protein